jgi:hypothetical protein
MKGGSSTGGERRVGVMAVTSSPWLAGPVLHPFQAGLHQRSELVTHRRAIEEAGLPIEVVGGTSIGAVMGAFYALGMDHAERVHQAITAFTCSGWLVSPHPSIGIALLRLPGGPVARPAPGAWPY